jgi:hypothetical protein
VIDQVQHIDGSPCLTESLDSPETLLQSRGVPRKVNIDESPKRLEVQSFASGVGCHQQSNFALLDGRFDFLAPNGCGIGSVE